MEEIKGTEVSLTSDGISCTMRSDADCITISDLMEHLIEPAIVAVGYTREALENYFKGE